MPNPFSWFKHNQYLQAHVSGAYLRPTPLEAGLPETPASHQQTIFRNLFLTRPGGASLGQDGSPSESFRGQSGVDLWSPLPLADFQSRPP